MGLFDEIGKFAKTAADKTSGMVEITKLNSKIGVQREIVAKLQGQVGEFYWRKYASGESCAPELDGVFAEIREAVAKLTALEEEVRSIREGEGAQGACPPAPGGFGCASCGERNDEGARFCRKCGSAIRPRAVAPERRSSSACPACGAPLNARAKFCGVCGGRVS